MHCNSNTDSDEASTCLSTIESSSVEQTEKKIIFESLLFFFSVCVLVVAVGRCGIGDDAVNKDASDPRQLTSNNCEFKILSFSSVRGSAGCV